MLFPLLSIGQIQVIRKDTERSPQINFCKDLDTLEESIDNAEI